MSQKAVIDASTIQLLPEFTLRSQAVDPETVERYRATLDRLPRIKVWQHPETGHIFLVDGRHILEANRAEAQPQVEAIFVEGNYEDALVQARSSNLSHGRPYSRPEWRQAVTDIVKIRYMRTNAWIAREAGCSAPTIARLRAELEANGNIPYLEYLEAEDGRLVYRQTREVEQPAQPGVASDEEISDQGVSAEAQETGVGVDQAPPGSKENLQGEPEAADQESGPGEPVKVILKLGRLGEPLAVEVGMWLDGQLEPIPVTLLVAVNPPKGLEQAAPGYNNCLIINEALARNLNLLFK